MKPHILDLLPDLTGKRVTIAGKGSSFDDRVVQDSDFSVSINETCPADLVVFNDWPVVLKLDPINYQWFAAPSGLHAHALDHLNLDSLSAIAKRMDALGTRLGAYDMHQLRRYPAHPVIETSTSTAEAALHIVALKGARDVTFTGIGDAYYGTGEDGRKFRGSTPHYKRLIQTYGIRTLGLVLT